MFLINKKNIHKVSCQTFKNCKIFKHTNFSTFTLDEHQSSPSRNADVKSKKDTVFKYYEKCTLKRT